MYTRRQCLPRVLRRALGHGGSNHTSRDALSSSHPSASALPSSQSNVSSAPPARVVVALAAADATVGFKPFPPWAAPPAHIAGRFLAILLVVSAGAPCRSAAASLKRFITNRTRPRFARQAAGVTSCLCEGSEVEKWRRTRGDREARGMTCMGVCKIALCLSIPIDRVTAFHPFEHFSGKEKG